MAWRNAYSLDTLIGQLNSSYTGWLFLGTKGDSAHQAVASDHNPNAQGVVTALDIGSGGVLDIHGLANNLAANPHPDLKYIISNRRIAEWQYNFQWRAYKGSDLHDTHIHVSVGRGDDGQSHQPYDDRVQWNVTGDNMSRDNINQSELDKISKAYTGTVASAVPAFQNNLGNPLDTALNNFEGYSETRNWRLRAEGYSDLENRIKALEASEQKLAQEVVARDKKIALLESQAGTGGEFNAIGQALVTMITKFGYRKG